MLILEIDVGEPVAIGDCLVVCSERKMKGQRFKIGIDDPDKTPVLREKHFPPHLAERANAIRNGKPTKAKGDGVLRDLIHARLLLTRLMAKEVHYSVMPSAAQTVKEIEDYLDGHLPNWRAGRQ